MRTFRTIHTVDFRMMPAPDHRVAERPLIKIPLQRDVRRARAANNYPSGSANVNQAVHSEVGGASVPASHTETVSLPLPTPMPLTLVNEISTLRGAAAPEFSKDKPESTGAQRGFR